MCNAGVWVWVCGYVVAVCTRYSVWLTSKAPWLASKLHSQRTTYTSKSVVRIHRDYLSPLVRHTSPLRLYRGDRATAAALYTGLQLCSVGALQCFIRVFVRPPTASITTTSSTTTPTTTAKTCWKIIAIFFWLLLLLVGARTSAFHAKFLSTSPPHQHNVSHQSDIAERK